MSAFALPARVYSTIPRPEPPGLRPPLFPATSEKTKMDWTEMSNLAGRVISGFASGEAATVGSVAISNVIESTVARDAVANRWGRDNTYQFSITVAVADLTDGLPAARSTLVYRDSTWRIIGMDHSKLAGTVTLHLADA